MKVFGIAGYSGSGKTTLIEKLLPELIARGLRVSVIKHAHHDFDLDQPGKDSYRHRASGACEVMITGDRRWALLHELRDEAEPALAEALGRFSPCDLVLIEGFKNEPLPKLEVHRAANGKPLLYPGNPWILALASDDPVTAALPVFGLDDVKAMAAFVVAHAIPAPAGPV